MLHKAATNNMLKELTCNTGQGHGPIIGWVCLVTFLVDGVYIGMFPIYLSLVTESIIF